MFMTENAVQPKSTTFEYYGWSWIGIRIIRLYFQRVTIENVALVLFCRFGIDRTYIYNL